MALDIELSAIRRTEADEIETCNDDVRNAVGFGVYIRNTDAAHPLDTSFHLRDFMASEFQSENFDSTFEVCLSKAYTAARKWTDGLTNHVGGRLDDRCCGVDPFRYGEGELRTVEVAGNPIGIKRFPNK
jgi:hypothetical protein